jgi:hypothetical protein
MLNAKYHTKDVKKKCESKLKIKFRKGKEFNGWYKLNNIKTARITVSKGKRPIPAKTYQTMAKQLKLTTEQFDSLLECPLTGAKYKKLITGLTT